MSAGLTPANWWATVEPKYVRPPYTITKATAATSPAFIVNFIFCDSSVYPFWEREIITTADNAIAPSGSIVWYPWDIPSANILLITGASFKSPSGDTTPIIIKNINAINKAGVKYCPMMSTTLDGLIVSTSVNPKNITENTIGLNPLKIGCIPISNVVAPVLGIAKSGPKQIIIAVARISDSVFPALPSTAFISPWHLAAANIASNANPTSAIIKPVNPVIHPLPLTTPRYGGKIKLPAPKNIANSANPTTMMSLFCLFMLKPP